MANQNDDRDDDEQKDADESDDEGSAGSSDEGEDEGSDERGEEEEAAAAPSDSVDDPAEDEAPAPKPAAPAPKGKAKPLSAGARVAAAKAAKAAKKAVKKAALAEERAAQQQTTTEPAPTSEEEAEDAVEQIKESAVGQAALQAQDWAKQNEGIVYGVLGLAAIALIGWFGYNYVTDSNAVAAATLLEDAVRISRAEIREEGEEPDTDEDADPTYATVEERDTAALEAYRRVISEHGDSEAAGWAQLGEARLLLAGGQPEEARAAFQAAVSGHGRDPVIAMRGYEGVGFTYEDEENWDEAREAFERIRSLANGDYAAVADYHLARIRLATGDEVGAQTALEELVDSIRESSESSEPEFPYVLAQAQTLLRELDPSSADGAEAPMLGGGAGGASEEEIMEMIRRAMAGREGGAGGAPAGGE